MKSFKKCFYGFRFHVEGEAEYECSQLLMNQKRNPIQTRKPGLTTQWGNILLSKQASNQEDYYEAQSSKLDVAASSKRSHRESKYLFRKCVVPGIFEATVPAMRVRLTLGDGI